MKNTCLTFAVYILMGFSTLQAAPSSLSDERTYADLHKKIGQMWLVGFKGTSIQQTPALAYAITEQRIGGVILYQADNIRNKSQLRQLTRDLQLLAKNASLSQDNHAYPLLIGIDYEGGKTNPLSEKLGFPKTIPALTFTQLTLTEREKLAKQMAETLFNLGINLNFSPVVDLNLNPENPVIGKLKRSFSHEPQQVASFAAMLSKAYDANHVLCTYKHFPGHGSSKGDTHRGQVDITHTWQAKELQPYQALLSKSYACPIVMTGHLVHRKLDPTGSPASLSHAMTTQLLRKKLHFNGVVLTDDLQMQAITKHYPEKSAIEQAINAGADLLMISGPLATKEEFDHLTETVIALVKSGRVSATRIEASYARIMQLKAKLRETSV